MLLGILLLLLSSASPAESQITYTPTSSPWITTTMRHNTATLPPLVLSASSLQKVEIGRKFLLSCSAMFTPAFTSWSWQRFERETWREVGHGQFLEVAEPKQSGLYRCHAQNPYSQSVSHNMTVYIVDLEPKAADKIGIIALVLSLFASITSLSILCLLVWRSCGDPLPSLNTAAKGFPGADKTPKGPQTECNGDVYMNYNTNQAYSDLDPVSMTGEGVYSSLS